MTQRRAPLSRDLVLRTAVTMADRDSIESLSMRRLAQALGVVPMALYKHVANKEELLDGITDAVIAEFAPAELTGDWRSVARARILSARATMLRHPWAAGVIASRTQPTPAALAHMESMISDFRAGGVSAALTHLAMHTIGSRIWGFNVEVFASAPPPTDPAQREAMIRTMGAAFPHILEVAMAAHHTSDQIVGDGCDDQFEFEFGLDVLLDAVDRLHQRGWEP